MQLSEHRENWTRLAKRDPLWAIATYADKKDNRWQRSEFLRTGDYPAWLCDRALVHNLPETRRGTLLDFGCGAARVSLALTRYFDHVTGIDIAEPMIDLARRHAAEGDCTGLCDFILNDREDLNLLPDGAFDVLFSYVVLQHMAPALSLRYIAEFPRLVRPGGALVFQVPIDPIPEERGDRAHEAAPERALTEGVIRMYGIPAEEVMAALESGGAHLIALDPDNGAGRLARSGLFTALRLPEKPATPETVGSPHRALPRLRGVRWFQTPGFGRWLRLDGNWLFHETLGWLQRFKLERDPSEETLWMTASGKGIVWKPGVPYQYAYYGDCQPIRYEPDSPLQTNLTTGETFSRLPLRRIVPEGGNECMALPSFN